MLVAVLQWVWFREGHSPSAAIPILIVIGADIQIGVLLLAVMLRSRRIAESIPLPEIDWATFIVFSIFVAFLFAFTTIDLSFGLIDTKNLQHKEEVNLTDADLAIYNTLIKIPTLAYREVVPKDEWVYLAVSLELVSNLMLFILAVPILAGRLADFSTTAGSFAPTQTIDVQKTADGFTATYGQAQVKGNKLQFTVIGDAAKLEKDQQVIDIKKTGAGFTIDYASTGRPPEDIKFKVTVQGDGIKAQQNDGVT